MNSTTTNAPLTAGCEPISGYRLEERIGIGGYGEVWRASAPGGSKWAIKIVHGLVGEARALREIRSLNRARDLDHPHILALERIEEYSGQLIIVTELADATLADRFEKCREQDLPGVPREELLRYVGEAADALDYLFENFALQHLDVKADNLLMFGDHIKVADFGLMKDLQESCQSLVNSLTPRYAAPEMFQGQPSPYSDQYSLAILYQEMLTGKLPFPGGNIAALASQHLNCAPDLTSLSGLDRFAVGKALSKDPEKRFRNSREFVERLSHQSSATILTGVSDVQGRGGRRNHHQGDFRENERDTTAEIHDGQTIQIASPEITSLPRVTLSATTPAYRPTLFVGLGGCGGKILSRLRQIFADRLGDTESLRAIQFLYVDTDSQNVGDVSASPWSEGLRDGEIVIAPLRQTKDYRSSPVCQLDSVSTRWIYNVPKTLRTHGLRALGRLALLDHSQRILARLRDAILACTDPAAVEESQSATGIPFEENDPRVFVVSSISGGTGGGMVIDLAYAVRQILAECGFSDEEVCGILTYGNGTGARNCSFAAANAYSVLEELRYFSQPGCDYPGEHARGFAGFREAGATFKSTYLFDMGDNLSDLSFSEQAEQIAEYLFLNSVTPAVAAFDECRRLERENPADEALSLRSAGLYQFDAATREDPTLYAESLCKLLVRKWKVGLRAALDEERIRLSDVQRLYDACDPNQTEDTYTPTLVRHKLDELQVNRDFIDNELRDQIACQLASRPSDFIATVIQDSLSVPNGERPGSASPIDVAARRLQAIIGYGEQGFSGDRNLISLREHVLPRAHAIGEGWGIELREWILGLIDTDFARVDGARTAATNVREHVTKLQSESAERLENSRQKVQALKRQVSDVQSEEFPSRKSQQKQIVGLLEQFAICLFEVVVEESIHKAFSTLDPIVSTGADQVREMWKDLTQLTDLFSTPPLEAVASHESRLGKLFNEKKEELIQALDEAVDTQFFVPIAPLREVLSQGNHLKQDLPSRMRLLARQVILNAYRSDSQEYLETKIAAMGDTQFKELVTKCLTEAEPDVLAAGGMKRLLISAPRKLKSPEYETLMERVVPDEPNFVYLAQGDLLFCYEVEQISWDGVNARLIRQRHDCDALAKRLHTRVNLDWTIV